MSFIVADTNEPLAGEYPAVATDLQGIAATQLDALRTKLTATKTTLEAFQANPTDTALIQNLTKEDLSGDLLYAGILGYFASVDGNARLAARSANQIIMQRLPSFGAFSATVSPNYFFGIVRTVAFEGLSMDVDLLFDQVEAKDNDPTKRRAYLRQTGSADSAFEHAVPEQLFKDPAKPADDPTQPQAVSAVKAIAIASGQGQRIYTLNAQNQANHATILASLTISQEVKTEISNALAAGKEVTTHEAKISAFGFSGSGYIILDPDTGTRAYKIEGGGNGAWVQAAQALIAIFILAKLTAGLAFLGIIAVGVSPFILLFAGAAALVAALLAGNPFQDSPVKGVIELIVTLTLIGVGAYVAFPLLFAFVYFALLLVIAKISMGLFVQSNVRFASLLAHDNACDPNERFAT